MEERRLVGLGGRREGGVRAKGRRSEGGEEGQHEPPNKILSGCPAIVLFPKSISYNPKLRRGCLFKVRVGF